MKKRILAILLVVVMIVGMLPVTSLAENAFVYGLLTSFEYETTGSAQNIYDGTYTPASTPSARLKPITPEKQADGTYTFAMPAYAVTVTAEFEAAHNVTAQVQGSHGSAKVEVDSTEVTEAIKDASVVFTATPDSGYAFDYWEVVSGGIALSETDTDDLYGKATSRWIKSRPVRKTVPSRFTVSIATL